MKNVIQEFHMFNILHLDKSVFKMHGAPVRWDDTAEFAERVAIFRMNYDPDTREGHEPPAYDKAMKTLPLSARFARMVQESPRRINGDFARFLQVRYDVLNTTTRTVKPRLTQALRNIFPKDPPVTLTDKGELISRHADAAAVASIVSEQEPECIWVSIERAGLDVHVPQNRVITPHDFSRMQAKPNDILGAMMDLAMRRQNASGLKTTIITDSDEGIEAALRSGIKKIRRYMPAGFTKNGADIRDLTRFHGFKLA
jgi:hypothetical protein